MLDGFNKHDLDGYYGDSAVLASNMEKDVAEKKRLLGSLGLLK